MTDRAAAWIAEQVPPDRDLEPDELVELAVAVGEKRPLWDELVRFDPEERVYVELYRDVHLDVWLISWLEHQDTGFHDHDRSDGAVYVCEGALAEERLQAENGVIGEIAVERRAGTVFPFDSARIHRMRNVGKEPAVSIHVYSPALWRMGHYGFDDAATLSRASITYADEMWTGRASELGAGFSP